MWKDKIQVNKVFFVVLCSVIIVTVVGFINQRVSFSEIRSALEASLSQSQEENSTLKGQLEGLQVTLDEKERELIKTCNEKDAFSAEIGELKVKLSRLNELINLVQDRNQTLQDKNSVLEKSVVRLQEDLRLWEGKIVTRDEAKLVLAKRGESLREVRKRIRELRIAAQTEIDKMQLAMGNHGYMVKDGSTTFAKDTAVELAPIVVKSPREEFED